VSRVVVPSEKRFSTRIARPSAMTLPGEATHLSEDAVQMAHARVAPATSLRIIDCQGNPLPNTLFGQARAPAHLVMILPGFGGHLADCPLLHYLERILLSRGADVLRLEYAYAGNAEFRRRSDREQDLWFLGDVTAAHEAALAHRPYTAFSLVGKSIGTLGMGHLLAVAPDMRTAKCVWITPLLRDRALRTQVCEARPPSLFVIGTADHHFDPRHLREVEEATGGRAITIEGADHSLRWPDDVPRSFRALWLMTEAMLAFL